MWRAFIDAMAEWNSVAICGRLALAILTGTVIGIDRGLKRRGAGIKTHALVCLGSALVMLTSEYMSMNFDQKADLARLRMCICGPENAKELLNHHDNIGNGETKSPGAYHSSRTLGMCLCGSGDWNRVCGRCSLYAGIHCCCIAPSE